MTRHTFGTIVAPIDAADRRRLTGLSVVCNGKRKAERLAALHRYRVLDTPAEPVFDDLVGLAAEITGSPTALISFVDAERQWSKAVHNFPFAQSIRGISSCARTIEQSDGVIVPDATADPRFAETRWSPAM